jgi:hypothetical protein
LLGFCFHRHKNICAAHNSTPTLAINITILNDRYPTYTNHIDNTITVSKR